MFDALLVSTGTVALAEIGDKTQLLALLLAARFRRPWPIVAGILVATLLNHALAGWLGALAAQWLTPGVLRWIVAGSFIAIALWTLKPDTMDEDTRLPARGAFVATTIAFFIAEIGDKTQVATILLAAKYHPLWQVVAACCWRTSRWSSSAAASPRACRSRPRASPPPACSWPLAYGPPSPACHTDAALTLAYPAALHPGSPRARPAIRPSRRPPAPAGASRCLDAGARNWR